MQHEQDNMMEKKGYNLDTESAHRILIGDDDVEVTTITFRAGIARRDSCLAAPDIEMDVRRIQKKWRSMAATLSVGCFPGVV